MLSIMYAATGEGGGRKEEPRRNECQTGETGISEWTRPERRPHYRNTLQLDSPPPQPSSRRRRNSPGTPAQRLGSLERPHRMGFAATTQDGPQHETWHGYGGCCVEGRKGHRRRRTRRGSTGCGSERTQHPVGLGALSCGAPSPTPRGDSNSLGV